jgi:PAS domain S-box-containing protein
MKSNPATTNLGSQTDQELDQNLRALQNDTAHAREIDELQTAMQELDVHRIELEMQNRALREAQAELEYAVQRYADLYDNLPIAYVTISSVGRIVGANRAAAEWLRTDRRELAGQYFNRFLDPYDAGRFAAHIENCLAHSGPAVIELTLRLGGGAVIAAQLSSRRAPAVRDAETQLHVAIADISKQRHAQRMLEEINREQEAFNYSISHDLRAPLVTINNYAGIVLNDYGSAIDPQAKSMVERIRLAAQRMEDTLKHLSEYSTLAREEIILQPVSADSVVTDLLIEHRAVIEQKQADILVDRPLPTVRAARDMLIQVIANLLSNALKYTLPGESPKLHISADVTESRAVLKVVDQGIGIDAKYHERIFKVFERLHGYSRYPGSGVGLAIAKRAVERMNGKIWCESEPGKGSCFFVELPLA